MVKKKSIIIIELLIIILLIGINLYETPIEKKDKEQTIVYYETEFQNGAVTINSDPYICGYNDGVCPNDYSPSKKVCATKEDPDCQAN